MRRRAVWGAITFVVWAVTAAPAEAQAWRWLEKLSGPGDFSGLQLDIKLVCGYEPTAKPRIVGVSLPCVKKLSEDGTWDPEKRTFASGFSLSYLRGRNDLPYAPVDQAIDRTIQLWTFEGFYDHRLSKNFQRVEVGVASGVYWFVVPAFEDFTRVTIEPRVSLRLFDIKQGDTYVGTFSIRLGWLFFTEGFKAADFGAIGPYESRSEGGPSFRFVIDFDQFSFK